VARSVNKEENFMSLRSIAAVLAVSTAVIMGSDVQAMQVANGLSANGLSANGLSANGLSANGLSANGLSANGLSANGASSRNFEIRSVTLPGGEQVTLR
jgi:hypothetical protein